jgi:hypothetical protein
MMQKLGMMVGADEVLYGSKERDKARQEKWLEGIYAADHKQTSWVTRLGSHIIGVVQALASVVETAGSQQSRAEHSAGIYEPDKRSRLSV